MEITFQNPIPAGWNPTTGIPSWIEIGSNFSLPQGHAHFTPPNKVGWTYTQAFQKGVTHYRARDFFNGSQTINTFRIQHPYKEYNDVPRTRDIFGLTKVGDDDWSNGYNSAWWPNGPYNETQARQKAQAANIGPRLWVGETMEGDDYIPEGHPMWGWFYNELKARYEAQRAIDGQPWFVAHNYFTRYGNDSYVLGKASRAVHESMYSLSASNMPSTIYKPGGTLADTNLIVLDLYLNNHDGVPDRVMNALFGMQMAARLGKDAALFWFDVHEWWPGFEHRIEMSDGVFARSEKAPVDPNLIMLFSCLAHEFGKVSVPWGHKAQMTTDITRIEDISHYSPGKDVWYPSTGGTAPYPRYVNSDYYQTEPPAYTSDLSNFGLRLWAGTGGQTVGGTDYFCEHRIDGGPWRAAAAHEIVSARYDKRNVVKARIKNGVMSVLHFNMYADTNVHLLEFKQPNNPSIIHSANIFGIGPHMAIFNV